MSNENVQVIVVSELAKNDIATHTFELLTLARNLGQNIDVVASTNDDFSADESLTSLGEHGANTFHSVNCGNGLSAQPLAKYIADLIGTNTSQGKKIIVLGPQTYLGRDVLSHLSVYVDQAILANAQNVVVDGDNIKTEHAIFGGTQILEAESSSSDVNLVLIRPKSIAPQPVQDPLSTQVVAGDASNHIGQTNTTTIISSEKVESLGPDLEDAQIVIAGGRGLGSQENFERLVEKPAQLLGAATGASRAIVDAGWVPYSKQIGQTGKTVKPDVYIACGISGATQHLVGMKGAKNIIAINTDDQAPIFSIADLGVVGDVNVIIPQLIEKIQQLK